MTIQFSRRLAICFGIFLPIAETARRCHQLGDITVWPYWLDDWVIGGLLLYGAWRARSDLAAGRSFLAAAWGFTCAMAYDSFFSQLEFLDAPDPSGISSRIIVTIKGAGLLLAVAALVATLKWKLAAPTDVR